jgi:hypothetical protein
LNANLAGVIDSVERRVFSRCSVTLSKKRIKPSFVYRLKRGQKSCWGLDYKWWMPCNYVLCFALHGWLVDAEGIEPYDTGRFDFQELWVTAIDCYDVRSRASQPCDSLYPCNRTKTHRKKAILYITISSRWVECRGERER